MLFQPSRALNPTDRPARASENGSWFEAHGAPRRRASGHQQLVQDGLRKAGL